MIICQVLISLSKGEKKASEVIFLGFSPQKAVEILLKKLEASIWFKKPKTYFSLTFQMTHFAVYLAFSKHANVTYQMF